MSERTGHTHSVHGYRLSPLDGSAHTSFISPSPPSHAEKWTESDVLLSARLGCLQLFGVIVLLKG